MDNSSQRQKITPFDLPSLMESVVNHYSYVAGKKGNRIAFKPEQSHDKVYGHVAYTHQIVSNYLSNAIKYGPLNSEVGVSIIQQADCWRVEIRDDGPGVPADERDMLFKEFARISSKSTAGKPSTRLGLAIVRKLAEAQGGRVGAIFPDRGGSIFWLEIHCGSKAAGSTIDRDN